jgi:hypothetical protein
MKNILCGVLIFISILFCAPVAKTQQNTQAKDPGPRPIQIEITQPKAPSSAEDASVSLVTCLAWPVFIFAGLLLFREPLGTFFKTVGNRATEFTIGGLGIKLSPMREAELGEDELKIRAADTFEIINDSAKRSLFKLFGESARNEFVAINLGRGDSWLSSRLYIFAMMLQRMNGLRCVVFLAPGADTESRFVGAMAPEKVRWCLARCQPWLEEAYCSAASLIKPIIIKNEFGALDPFVAEQLVTTFINNLRIQPVPPAKMEPGEWVTFSTSQLPEHATWLTAEYLEQCFGYVFWKDNLVVSDDKTELAKLFKCSAPFVAKTKKNGEFVAMIDRVACLDEVTQRLDNKRHGKD